MTQCKIEFTYASHCVCENVTPRRMLKKCLAIINRWNDSFRNMCYGKKFTVWPGKLILSTKKTKNTENDGQLFG